MQLQSFRAVNTDCVKHIVGRVKYTYCDMDLIPVREIVSCEKFWCSSGVLDGVSKY